MSQIVVLSATHPAIVHLCQRDKRLAKVITMVGDISYTPHSENGYAFLVHEIIEQMLSVKAGEKIYGRLEKLCGGDVTPQNLSRLSNDEIRSTGTASTKAGYIRGLTDAIISGSLNLDDLESLSDKDVLKSLTAIKGIGTWTAKMYLMFVLDRPDILPHEDVAFLQSYEWLYKTNDRSKEAVEKKCKKWKPYTSIASRYMYRALDMGLTKQPFHLFK